MKILLASASPRRKEILEKAGYDIEVRVPSGEELNIVGKEYSEDLVKKCAKVKAENALKYFTDIDKDTIIVTCDTVVVNDNIIIGKPKDKEDAFNILKSLSDKKHQVVSAICVVKDGNYKLDSEVTEVYFRKLSDEDINGYIEKSKPFDKAGSYGIQDDGFDFVDHIVGNIDNVIGFPMGAFYI